MATNYTGNATPTLNNAPANSWATDAEKRSHVGNTYLVTGSGGTSGNVYAFEEYPSAVVKEVPASGLPAEIVTITDGGENLPMTSAEVSLSPQQDLNGYDSPWPGGGGKNLAKVTDGTLEKNGVTFTWANDEIRLNGTCTGNAWIVPPVQQTITLPAGTYTMSVEITGATGSGNLVAYGLNASGIGYLYIPNSGGRLAKTFTIESELTARCDGYVYAGNVYNNAKIKFQIEAGSTATEWSPYSNICPISGHTGAELYRTGKNLILLNSNAILGSQSITVSYGDGGIVGTASGIYSRITYVFSIKKGKRYTVSFIGKSTGDYNKVYLGRKRSNINDYYGMISLSETEQRYTYSFDAVTDEFVPTFYVTASATSGTMTITDFQFELGSTATDYEPYQGDTYSVTFSDQGTVYGGTYDFVSGKLTVTMAAVDLGTLNYGYNATYGTFSAYKGDIKSHGMCISSQYKYGDGASAPDMTCCLGFGGWFVNNIVIKDSRYTDAATFKSAMSGVQLVYELATPLEYTLSDQQIETLLGENNVWSDAGEISNLVYRSNQYVMAYDWFETWTMPKITRNNGNIIVLPYPQEYTPEIYDVDASTTGRNAAGTMIRDRVAVKHKFNYRFPPLSQADATEILNAVRDSSFTLTTASPETGAKTNYRVYVGDRSLPVYWMPTHNNASWLYSSLSLNLIEM